MTEKFYVIGHKSPDLDSIASAICYAELKNILENTDKYVPAAAEKINQATKFILDKFSIPVPKILTDAEGHNIILVDHNEFSQAVSGIEKAKIIEIIDHHKLNFQYNEPITVDIKPFGACSSLIAQMYFDKNIEIKNEIAGLLLAAILDDTIITKSPTCTDIDRNVIDKLAKLSTVDDWRALGLDIFKIKSSIKDFSEPQIIKNDFKDFLLKVGKFGIGQVEMVDLGEVDERIEKLFEAMKNLHLKENYHSVILFFTDIINEGSLFLVVSSDTAKVEEALGYKLKNNCAYIPGILSRKKQVAPMLSKVFDV